MIMRAHLDWPVAAVGHAQADGATAHIEFDVARLDLIFTRNHEGCPRVLK
ncbi:hypothetical protein MCHI_002271 [Candidatus Magnetoovum chiemensis]|nr:hypothetical protein MCHI_002271 [Candidatus Magnetoovum chiemensis]